VEGQLKSGYNRSPVFGVHVFKAYKTSKRIADCSLVKAIKASQNPRSFQQYRLGNPDWPRRKQVLCRGCLASSLTSNRTTMLVSTESMAPNHLASDRRLHLRYRFHFTFRAQAADDLVESGFGKKYGGAQ
jgi:hypothetical protein